MKSIFLSILVCSCLAASSALAAVINVPADYWSIQDAIDAAAEQDTVMIAPGTYYENLRMHHKAVNLIGSGGIDNPNTIIKPDSAAPLLSFDSNVGHALITGLTFDGSQFTCVYFCCAKATFTNNVFRYNAWASTTVPVIKIEEQNVFPIRIENNLFHDNKGNTCIFADRWGAAEVIGNTFVNNQTCIIAGSDSITVVKNNIIAHSIGVGLLGTAVRSDCNDVYGNNPNYSPGLIPGPGDFSADPGFCNADSADFHLADGSPCTPAYNACSVLVGAFDVNCVACNDFDGDSLCFYEDNCPNVYNPDQSDIDGDGRGDVCDGCPTIPFESPIDFDGDNIPNDCDNCIWTANPSQADSDSDGWGDDCDLCVGFPCTTFCTSRPYFHEDGSYDVTHYLGTFRFIYGDSVGPYNPLGLDRDGKIGLTPGDLSVIRDWFWGGRSTNGSLPADRFTNNVD